MTNIASILLILGVFFLTSGISWLCFGIITFPSKYQCVNTRLGRQCLLSKKGTYNSYLDCAKECNNWNCYNKECVPTTSFTIDNTYENCQRTCH